MSMIQMAITTNYQRHENMIMMKFTKKQQSAIIQLAVAYSAYEEAQEDTTGWKLWAEILFEQQGETGIELIWNDTLAVQIAGYKQRNEAK
jgi:hypothetical protein